MNEKLFSRDTFPSLAQTISTLVHRVTSHYYYRDYCSEKYPEMNAHKCAIAIGFFKPASEFNTMLTGMKRIFIPSQHIEGITKDAIDEYKFIDSVFEIDGELYDNEDHYTYEQTKKLKEEGGFKDQEAASNFNKAVDDVLAKDELWWKNLISYEFNLINKS